MDLEENVELLRVEASVTEGDPAVRYRSQHRLHGGSFKGILSKVALVLGVCGIGVIAYNHFSPKKAFGVTADVKNSIDLDAVDPAPGIIAENVLKKSVGMHGKEGHIAGGQHGDAENLEIDALRELEAENLGDKPASSLQLHREAIRDAIEHLGDEDPEEANEEGTLVTSGVLQAVNGLADTPEMAPAAQQHLGDMVWPRGKPLKGNGRRLWAGNLWPDKTAIPYCFKSDIAASSKESFLRAVDHIETLVSCVGFKQVSAVWDKQCENGGIFVTSTSEGCWSYVGYVPSTNQQLNLMADGCDFLGIAAHEILHALGMAHEQARSDVNEHVAIFWQNIDQTQMINYEMDRNGDISLPYDIMSLMHYGDSDFAIPGTKTMQAIGDQRGQMGQRMGMSHADAQQLGLMYHCTAKKFLLCTNDLNKCTKEDCVCHHSDESKSPLVKTFSGWPTADCKRCEKMCPDIKTGTCLPQCGCGSGYDRQTFQMGGGGVCYACKVSASPAPLSPAQPAPAPPPASAPTQAPCLFPTSPSDCTQHNMAGCTTCDGSAPWCFTSSDGEWRECSAADDACQFPFEYNGKNYYTCTTDGNTQPWCSKVGGGTKYCGPAEGFPQASASGQTQGGMQPPTPSPPVMKRADSGGGAPDAVGGSSLR